MTSWEDVATMISIYEWISSMNAYPDLKDRLYVAIENELKAKLDLD